MQPPTGRLAQFAFAYRMAKRLDSKLTSVMLGIGLGVGVLVFALFYFVLIGGIVGLVIGIVLGLVFALLAALNTLSLRARKAQLKQIEGQPGAAYSVLDADRRLKKNWSLTPAVQFNRQQDSVHRLIGTGGIILIADGDASRTKQLVAAERKVLTRFLGPDVQVEELFVGNDEKADEVPLSKLVRNLTKRSYKSRALSAKQAGDYARRLEAVASKTGPMANMPKGPLPKGSRIPRGGMR